MLPWVSSNALGLAGGSRGVDQRGQVLGFHGAHQRIEDRIALAAALIGPGHQLAEGNRPFRRPRPRNP